MDATAADDRLVTIATGTVTHEKLGISIAIGENPVTVGRDRGCDLPIEDRLLSKRHCDFTAVPGRGVRLRDLSSKNHTFYMGALVEPHIWLVKEGTIRVGGSILHFAPGRKKKAVRAQLGPLASVDSYMQMLYENISAVLNIDVPLHITGESGTGKEVLARTIHAASDRATGPFVVVDLSQIPISLIESALFGHAKGAFTGATHEKKSPFEEAQGGVVFIDEVGHLPRDAQKGLLRVIEAREIYRVGESRPRKVDVRIISASRHDLNQLVNDDLFQVDVYNRLAAMPFELPALRDRRDDIEILTREILTHLGDVDAYDRISAEQFAWMKMQRWDKGNLRQLRHVLKIACGLPLSDDGLLNIERAMAINQGARRAAPLEHDDPFVRKLMRLGKTLTDVHDATSRILVEAYTRELKGNVGEIGQRLGLSRMGFYKLKRRLGINMDSERSDQDLRSRPDSTRRRATK